MDSPFTPNLISYIKKFTQSRLYFFLLAITILNGCKNEEIQNIEKTIPYISIDLKKTNDNIIQNFHTFFDSIKIIPLKNEDSLFRIGSLRKAIYYNRHFYLFDNDFSRLYSYDSVGNFVTQFGKAGLGSREFKGLSDFDIIPEKNSIGLFSNDDQAIFYYSIPDGVFQKKRKVGVFGSSIALLPNNNVLLYINNNYNDKSGKSNLILLDSNDKVVKRFLPFDTKATVFFTLTGFLSKLSDKEIFCSQSFDENIYVYNGDDIKNNMHISINSSNINKKKTNPRKMVKEKIFLDSISSFLGSTFLRNDKFIIGSYQHTLRREFFLYDIAKQEVNILTKRNINDALIQIIDCPLFLGSDGTIIFSIFPNDILRLKKTNKELFKSLISDPKYTQLSQLSSTSNPFLLIAKVKY